MIGWLRAHMHVIPLVLLSLALLVLVGNWVLSDANAQETYVTAALLAGGVGLFALKWRLIRRGPKE